MLSDFNETNPYVFYYVVEEWTNGRYPRTERLIGYDAGNRRKDVLRTVRSKNKREKNSIVALAKARSYLWCCYDCGKKGVIIGKSDLNGDDERIVARMGQDGAVEKMWANDQNAYIVAGECLYQVDSEGVIHELQRDISASFCCGKITDSFFALYSNHNKDCIMVYDNDVQKCKAYSCEIGCAGGVVCDCYEEVWSVGIYDGKISLVKGTGAEVGEFTSQALYVLDREWGRWEEYHLTDADFVSHFTGEGNAIFSHMRIGENKLFTQGAPIYAYMDVPMEFSVYDIETGRRRKLCLIGGWCNPKGDNIIASDNRNMYVQICSDRGMDIREINLENGENRVISNERFYLISTCAE